MARKTPPFEAYPTWTTARFWGFIRSALRAASSRWPPKYQVLHEARRASQSSNKRQRWDYQCAECTKWFPQKQVKVDHKIPVGTLKDFDDLSEFVRKMFCPVEGLQVLCGPCHDKIKTPADRALMETMNNIKKQYPREESSWRNMKSRCSNPNATGYEYYGGKGISYDPKWEDFINFYNDMGKRPANTSLDRIDYTKGYYKENCRWATPIMQARNTSANNYIEYNNEVLCIQEWAEKLNIKANTIVYRLRRGWSIPQALGVEKKPKKEYQGRLSLEDIEKLVVAIDGGTTQTEYGKTIGMDPSQISRIYNRFKSQEEKNGSK